jgi:hypothetical protein
MDFFEKNEIKFPAFKMKMKLKITIFDPEDNHTIDFFFKLLSDLAIPYSLLVRQHHETGSIC